MLPVYGQMNFYPQQSNQVPFPQYHSPNSESLPHQMGSNPANIPTMYMSWPHGGNYGYPVPCHTCCGHNGFPGGYYPPTLPCPHFVSAPPFQCNHSAFPQVYHPVQYAPPHHPMLQPRYEYDKSVLRDNHCCGCPNHTGNQKEDKTVKIEEMDSDSGKNGSDSLVPVQLGNDPYQVVWIPQELVKRNESKGQEKVPSEVKSPRQEPNGWYPLGMKDLGPLMQGGDRKKPHTEQEDPKRKFSFPIIWVPYDGQEEDGTNDRKTKEDGRKMRKMPSPEPIEEPSPASKVLPLKHTDGYERAGEARATPDNNGGKIEKSSSHKSIPVKQGGHHEERVSEEARRDGVGVPVKQVEDGVGKAPESNGKRQSSSPSKLPPVCLRVDPLPKKKNGNGSSRSPSPPGQKRRAKEASKDSSGVPGSPTSKDNTEQALKRKEIQPNRKEGRTIQVMQGAPVDNKANPVPVVHEPSKEVPERTTTGKAEEDSNKSSHSNEKKPERIVDMTAEAPLEGDERIDLSESAVGECQRVNRRNLTDVEAAVLIQSVYRGFEVRRWDPLKKLKQIAEVRAQLADVSNHIQVLESSEDLLKDNKQITAVGEMIMRLLLKLDSIQGLHPCLREIRKSVARDLVALQEKLDSLNAKKSKECIEGVSTASPAHHFDTITNAGVGEVQNKEVEQRLGESSCQSSSDSSVPVVDLPNSQCNTDGSLVGDENGSESTMEPKEEIRKEGLGLAEVADGEKTGFLKIDQEHHVQFPSMAEHKTKSEEEIIESVPQKLTADLNGETVEELEGSAQVISEKSAIVSEVGEHAEVKENESLHPGRTEKDSSNDSVLPAGADYSKPTDNDGDINLLAELPLGAVEADTVEKADDPKLADDNGEINLLAELPVGAVEADPVQPEYKAVESDLVAPESESHEQVGSDILGLGGGKSHYDAISDVSPPKEDSSEKLIEQQELETVDITESGDILKDGTHDGNELPIDAAVTLEGEQLEAEATGMISQPQMDSPPETDEVKRGEESDRSISDTQLGLEAEESIAREMVVPADEAKESENSSQQPERTDLEEAINDEQAETEVTDQLQGIEATKEPESKSVAAEQTEETEAPANKATFSDQRLIEENQKLRDMMAKLMETGKEQLTVISNLTGRVKDLEKKLSKKKKMRTMRRHKGATSVSSHVRQQNASMK